MIESSDVSINDFRTVLSLTDPEATVGQHVQDGVTAESLDHTFRKNKLSTGAIADANVDADIVNQPPLDEGIPEHQKQRRLWKERVERTVPQLDETGVDYLLIKNLRNPYTIMADVDVLVPSPDGVVRVAEAMVDDDYTLKQSRLLCHPLKINAHKYIDGENNPLDVYPDVIWVRKKVADGEAVLERGEPTEVGGVTVRMPAPEDSFHIVGTHAHAHLRLTLAEVLHGLAMIDDADDFDWDHVVSLARTYGAMDSIYLYCRAIDRYCELYRETSPVPDRVLDDLRDAAAVRRAEAWFQDDVAEPFTLPFYVPHRLGCVDSSLHYLRRSLGSMSLGDTVYGTLTHYVILANQVM